MADRELTILLRFAKEAAERAAQQFHRGERRRIEGTGEAQKKVDRELETNLRQSYQLKEQLARREEQAWVQRLNRRKRQEEQALTEQIGRSKQIIDGFIKDSQDRELKAEKVRVSLLIKRIRDHEAALRAEKKANEDHIRHGTQAYLDALNRRFKADEKSNQDYLKATRANLAAQKKVEQEAAADQKARIKSYSDAVNARFKAEEKSNQDYLKAVKATLSAESRVEQQTKRETKDKVKSYSDAVNRRIDAEEADRQRKAISNYNFALERMNRASARSQAGQRDESKKTKNAIEEQQKTIMRVSEAYSFMRAAALANQGIHFIFRAMSESAQQADRHIEDIVQHMKQMRDQAAEIMVMRGEAPTAIGTAQLASRAEKNAVTVEMQRRFEDQLHAQMQEVIGTRISQKDIDRMEIPTYVAAMGGTAGTEESGARVLDAIVRSAPTDKAGRVDVKQVQTDFADIMESVQVGKGHNEEAARQVAEVMNEYVGPGRMIEDPRKAAALMRIFLQGNERKGATIFRAMMKGQLQIRRDDEKMEKLAAYGVTGKESGDEFLFRSLDAIKRMAEDEGRDYHTVLSEFYNEIREFEGAELLKVRGVNEGQYKRALAGMQGGDAKRRQRIAQYRAGQMGRSRTSEAGAEAAALEAGSRYAELDIIRNQETKRLVGSGKLEEAERGIDAMASAAGKNITGADRREYALYQATGGKIEEGLRAFPESDEAAGFLAKNRLQLGPKDFFMRRETQAHGANLLKRLRDTEAERGPGKSRVAPTGGNFYRAAFIRAVEEMKREGTAPADTDAAALLEHPGKATAVYDRAATRASAILARMSPRSAAENLSAESRLRAGGGGDVGDGSGRRLDTRPPMTVDEMGRRFGAAAAAGPDAERHFAELSPPGLAAPGRNRANVVLPPGMRGSSAPRSGGRRGFRVDHRGHVHERLRRIGALGASAFEGDESPSPAHLVAARAQAQAAARPKVESEYQRAAREHIARNHADLEDLRARNRMPIPPAPIPKVEIPTAPFGHGPMARAVYGMLAPSGPAPAPKSFNDASAMWARGIDTQQDRDVIRSGASAYRHQGSPAHAAGAGGALLEAARMLKQAAGPPVPPAMPGRPAVMRN